MAIMYNANYLKFMERARTDFFRHLGFSKIAAATDYIFVVKNTNIEFIKPCGLDDLVTVTAEVQKIGNSSILFRQKMYNRLQILADATHTIVGVNKSTMKPSRISKQIKTSIINYAKLS